MDGILYLIALIFAVVGVALIAYAFLPDDPYTLSRSDMHEIRKMLDAAARTR